MKKLFFTLLFTLGALLCTSFSSKSADKHDVIGIYEKVELEDGSLDEDGEEISFVFVKSQIRDGQYEVEIGERVNSNLYQIRGTKYYMRFRYNPFLYSYDEGYLDWSFHSGTFYEKE